MTHNPHMLIKGEAFEKAFDSITRLDRDGYLYYIDCDYDYYDPKSPCVAIIDACCSVFTTLNTKGERLLCRNYDLRHLTGNDKKNGVPTGLNFVVRSSNPKAKYRSIGVADVWWLDREKGRMQKGAPDDGKTDISLLAAAPYIIMDGINEAGLSLAILSLRPEADWDPVPFEKWKDLAEKSELEPLVFEELGLKPEKSDAVSPTGRIAVNEKDGLAWKLSRRAVNQEKDGQPSLYHPVLMRRMLDYCATVDEAVAMARAACVKSPIPTNDYHICVSDKTGKTVVLEWLYNELQVIEGVRHVTNFWLSREDKMGGGQDRDEMLAVAIRRYPEIMKEDYCRHLLAAVSADPDFDISVTQYSVIYNMDRLSMKVWSWRDYDLCYEFKI